MNFDIHSYKHLHIFIRMNNQDMQDIENNNSGNQIGSSVNTDVNQQGSKVWDINNKFDRLIEVNNYIIDNLYDKDDSEDIYKNINLVKDVFEKIINPKHIIEFLIEHF